MPTTNRWVDLSNRSWCIWDSSVDFCKNIFNTLFLAPQPELRIDFSISLTLIVSALHWNSTFRFIWIMFLIRLNLKPESSYIGLCRLALVQLFAIGQSMLFKEYVKVDWICFYWELLLLNSHWPKIKSYIQEFPAIVKI